MVVVLLWDVRFVHGQVSQTCLCSFINLIRKISFLTVIYTLNNAGK
jgi:hypothetical protein